MNFTKNINNMTNKLEKEFTGKGEVAKMHFLQLYSNKTAYMYRVGVSTYHFEVFERKTVPLCIDFEKKIFSETDFKEIYPKSKDFGVWAWTFSDKTKAINKFNEL